MLLVLQIIDILKQMLVCGPDNDRDHDWVWGKFSQNLFSDSSLDGDMG